jgi:hypothetical protein
MEWYQYIAVFFSGLFSANAVPHFVSGVMGNKFPSPFSKPPGKGLSSPTVNVLWGAFNILAGYILLNVSKLQRGNRVGMLIFFAGIVLISLVAAKNFVQKHKE